MITSHTIGEITLSLSTLIYIIWFIPQIWMNYQRKSTAGLSLWMHGLLFLGYSADLLYGFGRHMQWQYRLVTIVGLIFLFLQHLQFAKYGLRTKALKINYALLSILIIALLVFAIFNFAVTHHSKMYYDRVGYFEDACFWLYAFPQMIKNFQQKSTAGLSMWFVILAVVLSILDLISALTLHWDFPSILNPTVEIFKKSILVAQVYYYRQSQHH